MHDLTEVERAILFTLKSEESVEISERNRRISEFSINFVKDSVSRNDPIISVIRRTGDRWSNFILVILNCGMFRHTELLRTINLLCTITEAPKISQRVLTQKLRAFERDGLVTRTVRPTAPVRTEYRLTPIGAELAGLIWQVVQWTLKHRDALTESQRAYDVNREKS